MADSVINIKTIEELRKFANEKGIVEILTRNKNKAYKAFYKISLEELKQDEAAEKVKEAVELLKKNVVFNEKNLKVLNNISKLSKLNVVLSGMNLCATCVGFAIMYAKLDKMSAQIADVVQQSKKGQDANTKFEFRKILSEHTNMLDCRKTKKYYSEQKLRELVDGENDVLNLLIDVFREDISNNKEDLLFSILSLAEMLSASIKFFDEEYYFNNKAAIGEGDRWHMSHDKWISTFKTLSSVEFTKMVQDLGFFDLGLNTIENDCFYINFSDQIQSLKQDIEDNQKLISSVDDRELFAQILNMNNEEIQSEIDSAFSQVGLSSENYQNAFRMAAA